MILDAGFLVSVDRGDSLAQSFLTAVEESEVELHTTEPVIAQVWRSQERQVRLGRFLRAVVIHPFTNGREVGLLLAATSTSDVVDAHLVAMATRLGLDVLTGDVVDITSLRDTISDAPFSVRPWPPR